MSINRNHFLVQQFLRSRHQSYTYLASCWYVEQFPRRNWFLNKPNHWALRSVRWKHIKFQRTGSTCVGRQNHGRSIWRMADAFLYQEIGLQHNFDNERLCLEHLNNPEKKGWFFFFFFLIHTIHYIFHFKQQKYKTNKKLSQHATHKYQK
jgi:hypothetical protein